MSRRSKNKKQQQETTKPVNYSLFNQKITFDFLKSHLWAAADILRGSLDPADYRQPIMTLLFIKRLNDTFEENAEKIVKEGKSEKEAYENKNRHYFFIPKQVRWPVLSKTSENIGEILFVPAAVVVGMVVVVAVVLFLVEDDNYNWYHLP